jgi:hypothetical protein
VTETRENEDLRPVVCHGGGKFVRAQVTSSKDANVLNDLLEDAHAANKCTAGPIEMHGASASLAGE